MGCDDLLKDNLESETISKPVVSPTPGVYEAAPTLSLTCDTEDAEIYYTTGEDDPASGTIYTGPFTLSPFPGTLKAVAIKAGKTSEILTAVYTTTGAPPSFGPGIYASGSYWDGNYSHAGYWGDGTWHTLATPSGAVSSGTNQIAISGADVYIAGDWAEAQDEQWTRHTGYWLNGVWYTLDTSTADGRKNVVDIAVVNGDIYVAGTRYAEANPDFPGMFNKRYAGYWLNGVWHDLSVPAGTVSDTVGISIYGENVYIGGYYQIVDDNYEMHPCYWLNGQRHDFPGSVKRVIVDITVSGGKVYAAELHSGYWIDDTWYILSGVKECIGVIGSDVYLAGWSADSNGNGHAGYWRNEDWAFLAEPAGAQGSGVLSISIADSNIYFIGYYGDLAGSHACYWRNGILQVLPNPTGAISSSVNDIAVVP